MSDVTVNDILEDIPVGSVIPLVVAVDEKDIPIIFIKDYEEEIHKIDDECMVGVKSTTIGNKQVNLYLLVFKFGEDFEHIYDMWFNYSFQGHKEFLKLLYEEDRIIVDFRNEENERIKTIQVDNTIREHIESYINESKELVVVKESTADNVITLGKVEKYKTWNENSMLKLIDKIFDDYPSVEDLWLNL